MAARRLLIVLVLLLAASVVAASLAPDRTGPSSGDDESSTTATTSADEPRPLGRALSDRLEASVEKPQTVEAAVGDQLALTIDSMSPRTIVIEPLGLAEFAAPDSPARFDLLLREAGAIPITDTEGEIVGRLLVAEATEVGRGGPGSGDGDAKDGDGGKAPIGAARA